ncbi:COQ9 family protein [Rubellimicrobium sp. CFH 75288]|uniref:COQ9 family protein n=1 Tax=Rubellimicrobium sp. CFH 75288 TaxID=2697034 RepID=UPI0014128215|nr:COQ9 family protein [Rubellimicrobium sp. CFH 75288]NAZ37929.1 COQ9 family protein [Rubellimicrobium sp. CFH 75288]
MTEPEDFAGDPTRRALLRAMLPHVPFDGWSDAAFRAAAREAELTLNEARAACPRGAVDLAAEWHREGDRAMKRILQTENLEGMRMRDRVAFAVKTRLRLVEDREALRRSAALFALPQNAALGARLLWETADAIWTTLGDRSRDGNWYTKRATLAAVLASATLYRLSDDDPALEATGAFVDRRIDEVMAFETWKNGSAANPLLRPLARPLDWIIRHVRAPAPPTDLPGSR